MALMQFRVKRTCLYTIKLFTEKGLSVRIGTAEAAAAAIIVDGRA
jgi:hypothetical protein